MAKFSKASLARLKTCHPDLQKICNELIKRTDFSITAGHRGEAEQNKAYEDGHSKLKYPESKHNTYPSLAIDIVPYPVDWSNIDPFKALAVEFKKVAKELGIEVVWGGDWKTFKDYPHYELKEK
jgi:peptidoglycan L-alanyl-D-glutamate endopeptidase CwlK